MDRPKLLVAAGVVIALVALAVIQGRADARVDRLALRVDSLAITLTDVVALLGPSGAAGSARPPAPATDTLTVAAAGPVRGRLDAPVTLVEFLDYECPYCRRFHAETLPVLLEEYVATGRVRIVLRDLPLAIHEHAMPAARAARCVAEQGEAYYWRYSDALLAVDGPLDAGRIRSAARDLGLDPDEIAACAATGRHDEPIAADSRAASEAGLTGTPSFVIGPTDPDGSVRGRVIRGAYPIAVFRDAIEGALEATAADA